MLAHIKAAHATVWGVFVFYISRPILIFEKAEALGHRSLTPKNTWQNSSVQVSRDATFAKTTVPLERNTHLTCQKRSGQLLSAILKH